MDEIDAILSTLEKLITDTGEQYKRGKYVIVAGIGMMVVDDGDVKETDARTGDGVFKVVEVDLHEDV